MNCFWPSTLFVCSLELSMLFFLLLLVLPLNIINYFPDNQNIFLSLVAHFNCPFWRMENIVKHKECRVKIEKLFLIMNVCNSFLSYWAIYCTLTCYDNIWAALSQCFILKVGKSCLVSKKLLTYTRPKVLKNLTGLSQWTKLLWYLTQLPQPEFLTSLLFGKETIKTLTQTEEKHVNVLGVLLIYWCIVLDAFQDLVMSTGFQSSSNIWIM